MLYTIERDFSGYSDEQVEAAGFRALLCIGFFPGMRWVRSFYDRETRQARCFYEANMPGDLVHHGRSMAIPIGEVRPVTEVRREGDGIATGDPTDTADTREGDLDVWTVRFQAEGRDMADLLDRFRADDVREGTWVRAFLDIDIDEVFGVFQGPDRATVEADVHRIRLPVKQVAAVGEVLPSDFREMPPMAAK